MQWNPFFVLTMGFILLFASVVQGVSLIFMYFTPQVVQSVFTRTTHQHKWLLWNPADLPFVMWRNKQNHHITMTLRGRSFVKSSAEWNFLLIRCKSKKGFFFLSSYQLNYLYFSSQNLWLKCTLHLYSFICNSERDLKLCLIGCFVPFCLGLLWTMEYWWCKCNYLEQCVLSLGYELSAHN